MPNKCENCEFFKDVFGNYVECVKLHKLVDWWYWNNKEVDDCPLAENLAPQPSDIRPIEGNKEEYEDDIVYINGEPVKMRHKVYRGTFDVSTGIVTVKKFNPTPSD